MRDGVDGFLFENLDDMVVKTELVASDDGFGTACRSRRKPGRGRLPWMSLASGCRRSSISVGTDLSQGKQSVEQPSVRLVVLNYNGGGHVLRCLEHLQRIDWPNDHLEIVVVDNDSRDGSDRRIEESFDRVRLVRTERNLGFPGNNRALKDLDSITYVGLVNNDAFVEPGWLVPLAAALTGDPGLGAACPKIVFDNQVVPVELSSLTVRVAGDPRELGLRVSGVRAAGTDLWPACRFLDGFFPLEPRNSDGARVSLDRPTCDARPFGRERTVSSSRGRAPTRRCRPDNGQNRRRWAGDTRGGSPPILRGCESRSTDHQSISSTTWVPGWWRGATPATAV